MNTSQLLGLTEMDARKLSVTSGFVFRVVKNGTGVFNLTEDNRPDRINVSIMNGRVVNATIG